MKPLVLLQQTSGAVHVSTACMTLVDEFWKTDCLQEETVEQFLIEVNGDDDEDVQDDDGSDEEVFVD